MFEMFCLEVIDIFTSKHEIVRDEICHNTGNCVMCMLTLTDAMKTDFH